MPNNPHTTAEETQPTQDEKIRAEWLEKAKYPGDNINPKLGCCGGDYCELTVEGHNNVIADWFLSRRQQEIDELRAAVEGLKLIEAATSPERLAQKQFYNNALDKVLNLLTKAD